MITDQDIEKLKQVFATKEDLHQQTATIAEEFKGMLQLMSEMEQRLIDRMDQKFARQDEKFYKLLEKMNDQYSILFNQEKRIAKVEHKL